MVPSLPRMRRAVPQSRPTARQRDQVIRKIAARGPLEHRLTAGEDLVERVLEVRGAVGELAPHLFDVLLVALFNLFREQIAQRAGAQSFVATVREIRHELSL